MVNTPEIVGLRDFARLIGKKQSYVTLLKQTDRLVLNSDGKVLVAESLQRIKDTSDPAKTAVAARHAQNRGEGDIPVPPKAAVVAPEPAESDEAEDLAGNASYQASRARREYFEAKARERDYLLSIGQLLRADEVVSAVAGAVAALRQRLEILPDVLAPRLAAEVDEGNIRALLAEEIEHALDEAARHFSTVAKTQETQ